MDYEIIGSWETSIINHLYWHVSCTVDGDREIILALIRTHEGSHLNAFHLQSTCIHVFVQVCFTVGGNRLDCHSNLTSSGSCSVNYGIAKGIMLKISFLMY